MQRSGPCVQPHFQITRLPVAHDPILRTGKNIRIKKIGRRRINGACKGTSGDDTEKKRRNETRITENFIVEILHVIFYRLIMSKSKRCSSRNNAHEHDQQGDMEICGNGSINFGEAGK